MSAIFCDTINTYCTSTTNNYTVLSKDTFAATICAHLFEPRLEAFLYEFVVDKNDLVDLNAVISSKDGLRIFISFLS